MADPQTTPLGAAIEAAAGTHAILDMGRGNVSDFDRNAVRHIARSFLGAVHKWNQDRTPDERIELADLYRELERTHG